MKYSIKLSTFLLLTTVPIIALSEDLIVLDEIIVTAGYKDTGIDETGASVSVISELELQNATLGISQAFESVPGVSMDTNGGLGTTTGISVRGLRPKYINVRIDGMDVTDPAGTQTSYDFGALPGMGLGQVEFIKGSQSAVFGSEAVGGVINLKTLSSDQEGSRGTFTSEVGSYDTYAAGLTYESVGDNGFAALSLSRVQTKGFSAKKTFSNGDADNEADPYSGNHLRFVFGHTVNEYVGFNLAALNSSETSDYDQYSPLTDKLDRDTQSVKVGLVLNFAGISNEISITEGDLTRKYTGSTYDSDRQDIEYKGQTSIGGTDLIFGAASSKEAMVSTWGDKGSDTEKAIFVDVLRKISSSLDVSATMRQTESDDFSSNTSYRLAGIYNLENGIRLRAMGSTGFRAPSLYERYSGNAVNLKPEESQTQELGLEKVYEDGSSARVTVFNTKIENLIEYDTSLVTLSTPWGDYGQSNSVLKSQGLEVEGVWKMSDNIFLKGSYTYTDAKQGTTPAVRVPKYDYSGSVSVDVSPEITSSLSINYIVDYKDTTGDMPDYTVVNASSKYAFNEKLEGYLRVQNLMDADYETVKDFNTGGRQIFAGIRATF
jgi:vitamin B12 transporter